MERAAILERLTAAYADPAGLGLVLGAGVSCGSGVPLYPALALRVLRTARADGLLDAVDPRLLDALLRSPPALAAPPEQVLALVADQLDSRRRLAWLIHGALYRSVVLRSHRMVAASTYRDNRTLDAVISLCAAVPGSAVAEDDRGNWQTNTRVGAILTLNYDYLVEGAFGSKYEARLLRPLVRPGERSRIGGRRVIQVHHMHGHVSYVTDKRREPDGLGTSPLVVGERDYYRSFHERGGWAERAAVAVLGGHPCLFLGCSMTDVNVRRILDRLRRAPDGPRHEHVAVLPSADPAREALDDALLASLGVRVLRGGPVEQLGDTIITLLRDLYLSAAGVDARHWDAVRQGGRPRPRPRAARRRPVS